MSVEPKVGAFTIWAQKKRPPVGRRLSSIYLNINSPFKAVSFKQNRL
jgi:hypothetical protein